MTQPSAARGTPVEDPLSHFFAVLRAARPERYEGGEHIWLGNSGADRAVAARRMPSFGPFKRKLSPETLTYGEIVAFSGDFYATPDDLYGEKPSPLPWLYEKDNFKGLREALSKELTWINRPPEARGTGYPDENIALWWNAKWFTELALRNTSHFGWHNALTYAQWHEAALTLVAQAAAAPDDATRSQLFDQAVYTNGFADHFLTDGFAAGHVRIPAGQIRSWATEQGFNPTLASVLVKLVHDQDGHVAEMHGQQEGTRGNEGLNVTNARGDVWRTRCDGQLFLDGNNDTAVERAVAAVAESVGELLDVYNGAAAPTGTFAAARHLPWVHGNERALVDKFPADLSDDAAKTLNDGIHWYLKIPVLSADVKPEHIQRLYRSLPQLVAAFRDEVVTEASTAVAVRRLPTEYVEAFKAVR